ncbi:hypothetical protein AB0N24_07205 [Arthrobacter sp. NPDC093128]|uniref:hypothetical protein n=1 Tax=Arthrobacter sp. NPDC093128 TaxID=3154979 RepID=UPI003444FBA2
MVTLNYTGRREIDRSKVQIRVRQDNDKVLLDVLSLGLEDLDVPATAEVTVEAYRQTSKERVSCGTVGEPQRPQDVHLAAFDVTDNLQLRVRVVGMEGNSHGKVLAVADRLRSTTEQDSSSEPLLRLQRTELGDLIWKFDLDTGPILCVNKRLQKHDEIVHSPLFKTLVLPEFFRRVAIWVANNIDDSADPNSTLSHWLIYFTRIGVDLDLLHEMDRDDSFDDTVGTWAADAASIFASKIDALDLLNSSKPFGSDD